MKVTGRKAALIRWVTLVWILMLGVCSFGYGQGRVIRFDHLSIDDGLSQSSVFAVAQDRAGFMWFGTQDGLNRYDGYEFLVFKHDPADPGSLSNNFVESLLVDAAGVLWVGTNGGGLNRRGPDGRFSVFKHDAADPGSLGHNRVTAMLEDRDGVLWVGTYGGGLQKVEIAADGAVSFKRYTSANGAPRGFHAVNALLEDRDGVLWIAPAGTGLVKFDKYTETLEVLPDGTIPADTGAVTCMLRDSEDFFWIGSDQGALFRFNPGKREFLPFVSRTEGTWEPRGRIRAMVEDRRGDLWIADDDSLSRLDKSTGHIDRYTHDPADPTGLSSGAANTLFVDRTGVLWIGFNFRGLDKHDPDSSRFVHYRHSPGDGASLSDNSVMSMLVDRRGDLWVGTFAGGLNRLHNERFHHYRANGPDGSAPRGDLIAALTEDRDGRIWVGGDGGLDVYDPESGSFEPVTGDADTPVDQLVLAIQEGRDQRMWIGVEGRGLIEHDRASGDFSLKTAPDASSTTGPDRIRALLLDTRDGLWVGSTYQGLARWDLQSGDFVRYQYRPGGVGLIGSNRIYALFEDRREQIWVGAGGGGLNLYNRAEDSFVQFRGKDGLPDDTVYAIQEDGSGYLWLSSNQGLTRFDPRARRAHNFDVSDGLQSREFNQGAATSGPDGLLYFGGINGFNVFFPEPVLLVSEPPAVAITDFQIFNQSVAPQSAVASAVGSGMDQHGTLKLDYRDSVFAFEFAALHFADSAKNQYAHRLVGFDTAWVFTGADQRRAVYMNLDSGRYTFEVKASNKDGRWSTAPVAVKVWIQPAPWKTWWAGILYLVAAVGLLALIRGFIINKRKVLYEQEMIRGLKHLDRMKDDFLLNTSRELRTPLEGIVSLAETLIDRLDPKTDTRDRGDLFMIANRGRRLINLVNDIQDFSKLKHNDIELSRKPVDFHTLVNVAFALNKPGLGDKNVALINDLPAETAPVDGDENRLLQMMNNLVGNALKFTEQGSIRVTGEARDGMLTVHLEDTGRGLPEELQQAVLGPLEQTPTSVSRIFDGTSLGLSICKLVVALHGGRISLETQPGKGTVFHFTLPLVIGNGGAALAAGTGSVSRIMPVEQDQKPAPVATETDESPFHILIVDDDEINRRVVANHLNLRSYRLSEASNGADALKLLEVDDTIDLVLLDIMMPRMSGFEVCEALRKTFPIHELPVIILSARNQVHDLELGFAVGANDYLTKPVSKLELAARVTVHLRILEMNRNLDQMVTERTRDLKYKNEEMEGLLRQLEQKNKEVSSAHQQLVIKEKMANLGNLTAGIAHEIKNPTNYIAISLNNLERALEKFEVFLLDLAGEDADEEVRDSFQEQFGALHSHVLLAREGSQRVMSILANLNAVSRSGHISAIRASLADQIASTVRLVETQYKNDVEFELDLKDPLEIECLPNEMSQVFMNLIVNGCQALVDRWGGKPEKGRFRISAKIQNGLGVITFSDNGSGMPERVRERIFEPFFTTKGEQDGTGLGLAISHKIIKRHGGRIEVSSAVGEGATFTLYLPVAAYGTIRSSMTAGDGLS